MELKNIFGYLPYGLKWMPIQIKRQNLPFSSRWDYVREGYISELDLEMLHKVVENLNEYPFDPQKRTYFLKPILRPLSDLTKEIEINGEKFVPIVIIAKMFGFDGLEKFELDDESVEYGWVEHYMDDSQPYSFGYFQNGEFGTWYDDIDESHPIQVHCKMEVIEWLYKHHFDTYDLIGKGLAVDINTINQK